jgi:hypothetical protein
MNGGLYHLLEGAIDYAGLFPPAQLPLEAALRNYARYRQDNDSWMLGRFVLPVVRLRDLDHYIPELFGAGPQLCLAALGSAGDSATDFSGAICSDVQAVSDLWARHIHRVRIEAYETSVPHELLAEASTGPSPSAVEVAFAGFGEEVVVFYEFPWLHKLAVKFQSLRGPLVPEGPGNIKPAAGYKLRCGGLKAEAFPPAERVAAFIHLCRKAGVLLKFTAGLHHPLPRFDPSVGVTMYGFVNVLTACVLAHACGSPEEVLREVLQDADPGHFAFNSNGLRWKGCYASTEEIRAARNAMGMSFGSCSFDEPREDLRALGWL